MKSINNARVSQSRNIAVISASEFCVGVEL